jgi:SMODS and SLOG-associating 2TM effector domain 1/SMODS and SLOG-associating 2TM effector domain 3
MSAMSQWAQDSIGIAPADLGRFERAAAHQQRLARRLQAAYLLILLAAPLSRLIPLPGGDDTRVDERTAAVLLLAAVGMRLLLRRVAADTDWVRARRESEDLLAAVWRRCMAGRADPEDGPNGRRISTADVPTRWAFYREHRLDDQIGYFADRAGRHRRAARRWYWIRLVLTVSTVAVAAISLAVVVPGTVIGLVSALLATSEAWLQFRRSDVLAGSFSEAGEELAALRELQPADEAALVAAVDAVELVLERERWTWTAIMSITVLTSSGERPVPERAGSSAR